MGWGTLLPALSSARAAHTCGEATRATCLEVGRGLRVLHVQSTWFTMQPTTNGPGPRPSKELHWQHIHPAVRVPLGTPWVTRRGPSWLQRRNIFYTKNNQRKIRSNTMKGMKMPPSAVFSRSSFSRASLQTRPLWPWRWPCARGREAGALPEKKQINPPLLFSLCNNGIYCSKKEEEEMLCQATKRSGRALDTCYYVKEANPKRPHTVWRQPRDISEKAKLWRLRGDRGCQGWRRGRGDERSTRFRAVCVHCDGACMSLYMSKPTECITPRVDPNVNYRFEWIPMYPNQLIICNQCTTRMQDVNTRNGGMRAERGRMGMFYYLLNFL